MDHTVGSQGSYRLSGSCLCFPCRWALYRGGRTLAPGNATLKNFSANQRGYQSSSSFQYPKRPPLAQTSSPALLAAGLLTKTGHACCGNHGPASLLKQAGALPVASVELCQRAAAEELTAGLDLARTRFPLLTPRFTPVSLHCRQPIGTGIAEQ